MKCNCLYAVGRFCLPGILFSVLSATGTTVTIVPDSQYQTIQGFGVYATPNGDPKFLHDDLGVTLVRLGIPNEFELSNDNNDPLSINGDGFNDAALNDVIDRINEYKSYSDVKFFASCWTPPLWMKDMSRDAMGWCWGVGTDLRTCGGHLKPEYYGEYAEFLVHFVKTVRQKTGVEIYALSIQNESAFPEPYISCVYTPVEYDSALKVIGARFSAEGLTTKFIGAEDMLGNVSSTSYARTIYLDSVANSYLYAVAVHGYVDGVNPVTSSMGGLMWSRLGNVAVKLMKKEAWMTETGGIDDTWSGALTVANNIYMGLAYASLSAWVWWTDDECLPNCFNCALTCSHQHTLRSLVSKNFYRYIRPGAIRLKTSVSDTTIFAVSFYHRTNNTATIVIVNPGTTDTVSFISPYGASSFHKVVTTETKKCIDEGTVQIGTPLRIDASSVTTLYCESPVTAVVNRTYATRSGMYGNDAIYSVDGRRIQKSKLMQHGLLLVKKDKFGSARLIAPKW